MRAVATLLAALLGCQDDGGSPSTDDAGQPDGGDEERAVAEPAPPQPPAPPVVPCAEGWRAVEDGACDPWPASGPEACDDDEAHFPGEAACARIGPACPAGDWAEDLPDDSGVVFVKPGVGPGGDGSRDAPYGTIASAIARARDGDVVALAKGQYAEAVQVEREVTLWGACVAETILTPPSVHTNPTLALMDRCVGLKNVSITGSERPGLAVVSSVRPVELEAVSIRDVNLYGLAVGTSGQVHATDLVIRGVLSSEQFGASALRVEEGSQAEIARASIEASRTTGVRVVGVGTSVILSDVVVRDTVSERATSGFALEVNDGAHLDLQRAAFFHNEGVAIDIYNTSTVVAADVAVLGSRANAIDPESGGALRARLGAQVEIVRAGFTDNQGYGIGAADEGTLIDVSDVFIRGTIEKESGDHGGFGVVALGGAVVTVTRGVVDQNQEAGLATDGAGTRIEGTDVVIRGTTPPSGNLELGFGIAMAVGSEVRLERVLVESNRTLGIDVNGEGTTFHATDLLVRDTLPEQDNLDHGMGLQILLGGQAELERAAFEGNRTTGIGIFEGSLEGRDITVEDTHSNEADRQSGFGLQASAGARVVLERVRFSRNRDATVLVGGEATVVDLTDAVVEDTLPRECVVDECVDAGGGTGLAVVLGGTLEVRRFRLTGNAICGLQIASDGSVDLHEGEVTGNPIAVNLQVDDYDVSRLEDEVVYRDNDRTLDSSRLPLPDAEGVDL